MERVVRCRSPQPLYCEMGGCLEDRSVGTSCADVDRLDAGAAVADLYGFVDSDCSRTGNGDACVTRAMPPETIPKTRKTTAAMNALRIVSIRTSSKI